MASFAPMVGTQGAQLPFTHVRALLGSSCVKYSIVVGLREIDVMETFPYYRRSSSRQHSVSLP